MEHHPTNFGARLRALIDRKNLSLAQFAADYGISESQLHNWLKRSAPPLEKHWERLANFFGVSPRYLAYGTPEKSEQIGGPLAASKSAEELKQGIETAIQEVLSAADDDVARLGWIKEQLRAHLSIPTHWGSTDAAISQAKQLLESVKRSAQRRDVSDQAS